MANSTSLPPTADIHSPDVPEENNPEVMTALVHKLGLSSTLSFHDVYSLDDPSLLAFVPRPVLALLLVFPVSKTYETARVAEDSSLPTYSGYGSDEEVLWFRQTIGNACAKDTPLAKLIVEATPLSPEPRARLIENTPAIASAHEFAASQGDTAALSATASVDLHFVAFIKSSQNHLWELDGRRKGPLNRGNLPDGDDALADRALELGVKAFLKREEEAGGGDLRFSLLALAPSFE
ncbi:MAG: hypothetical protein Q9191_000357 [Dirinaria sp. TL-2023a]